MNEQQISLKQELIIDWISTVCACHYADKIEIANYFALQGIIQTRKAAQYGQPFLINEDLRILTTPI